jgi:hypothetical protein
MQNKLNGNLYSSSWAEVFVWLGTPVAVCFHFVRKEHVTFNRNKENCIHHVRLNENYGKCCRKSETFRLLYCEVGGKDFPQVFLVITVFPFSLGSC